MPMTSAAWTDARLAKLAKVKGLSTEAIIDTLNQLPGPRLSKGAVIGKRNRLYGARFTIRKKTDAEKEQALASVRQKDAEKKRAKRAEAKRALGIDGRLLRVGAQVAAINRTATTYAQPVCREADVQPLRKTIADVGFGQCRYPYDSNADECAKDGLSYRYCGHQVFGLGSWCPAHQRLVYGAGTVSERAAHKGLPA